MGKQRKYLDRGRQIRLDGQPVRADWMDLLMYGARAAMTDSATPARYLEETEWEWEKEWARPPRPALFDFPRLRSWLDIDAEGATRFLQLEWAIPREPTWGRPIGTGADYEADGIALLPDTADAARTMLASAECEGAHHTRLIARKTLAIGDGIWAAGICGGCLRAGLSYFPTSMQAGTAGTWTFYDQERTGAVS